MRASAAETQRRAETDPSSSGDAAPPGAAIRARRWIAPAALVLLHLALALLAFDPTPHTGGDNAAYITLARSLLERHAYLELWNPATPPHTQYPPVFPAVLAVAMLAGLRSWVSLKLVVVAFSASAVALSYAWAARRLGERSALGVVLVLAVSPGVLEQSHWVLSDVPFWALTMLALWALDRAAPPRGMHFAVALAAILLAYFTRSAGLPLVVATAGWLALRRAWWRLALVAGTLLPLAGLWALRDQAFGGIDYVGQFLAVNPYQPELGWIGPTDLLVRVAANAASYAVRHVPVLLIGVEGVLVIGLGLLFAAAALGGWLLRVRRPGVAELFFPLYLGLLLVWPAIWSGERFLLPVLPLLLAYGADAAAWVGRRARPAAARVLGPALLVALLIAGAPALVYSVVRGTRCSALYRAGEPYPCLPEPWRDYFDVAQWAAEELPPDAVVVSRKPRLFYALSGLPGRLYPLSSEPDVLIAAATDAGARYVVLDHLDDLSAFYLNQIVLRRPRAFCGLASLGEERATVLGILPDAGAAPDAAGAPTGDLQEVTFAVCSADYRRTSAIE